MKALLLFLALLLVVCAGRSSFAQQSIAAAPEPSSNQEPTQAAPQNTQDQDQRSTVENTIDATEASVKPRRRLVRWNEYEGSHFTIAFHAGFLYDVAGYAQSAESKQQITLKPHDKIRDFRLILNGRFPSLKRSVTWSAGIMYDAPTGDWLMRQTGIMVAVPELRGHFFIGRSKEGFSLNKVMVGYDGWTMERATINDSIPILADGIKWLGYSPKRGFLWNLGYFNDWLSKGQSFSTYSSQGVARLAWLPIRPAEDQPNLIHLGMNLRYGKPVDDSLRLRSRPESFLAPFFVDTGAIPSGGTRMAGYEAYYRKGQYLLGSEYWFVSVNSRATNHPLFHGGDVFFVWNITGEIRTYNTVGGFFRAVSPNRPVFQGGPGAWELVFRYSYIDLDSDTVRGGRFARFTPMLNWHLSDNVRLELAYGYGRLNRFDLQGKTHFFQSRIQLQL
jgi:phosphate-selective porin OprO/OprP